MWCGVVGCGRTPCTGVLASSYRHFSVARGARSANMGNGNRDSKKLQIICRHASRASRALWPGSMRRSLIIRRLMTTRAKPQRAVATQSGGLKRMMARAIACLFRVIARLRQLFGQSQKSAGSPSFGMTRATQASPPLFAAAPAPTTDSLARGESKGAAEKPLGDQLTAGNLLPETPMPSEPRIRVLETVDLSQTGVEHFLGSDVKTN